MGDINFENLKRINEDGFDIVTFNPRKKNSYKSDNGTLMPCVNEPEDGTIQYKNKLYYFKFSHEFDYGNTYVVYEQNVPVFYFMLYTDIDGDIDSPMLKYEK